MVFPCGSAVKNPAAMQETQEICIRFLGQEDPQEEEMETHSSTLARKIPWTEEPGGLHSMGSQRVGRDRVTEHKPKHFQETSSLVLLKYPKMGVPWCSLPCTGK